MMNGNQELKNVVVSAIMELPWESRENLWDYLAKKGFIKETIGRFISRPPKTSS